jgi:hypothetical protein
LTVKYSKLKNFFTSVYKTTVPQRNIDWGFECIVLVCVLYAELLKRCIRVKLYLIFLPENIKGRDCLGDLSIDKKIILRV